jgi:hypothetical protein
MIEILGGQLVHVLIIRESSEVLSHFISVNVSKIMSSLRC